jgi:hypothetical protein
MKSVLAFIARYFTMIPVKYRFIALVALAFASFIAFANISSYTADQIGANWVLWVVGIIAGLLTAAIGYIAFSEN